MTPIEIADELSRVIAFYPKHVAVPVDRAVLEDAVNALRVFARVAPQHGGLARVIEVPTAGETTE